MEKVKLLEDVKLDCKNLGYVNSMPSSVVDLKNKTYVKTFWVEADKYVLIEVVNAHNDYRDVPQMHYRKVCKELIDFGYVIEMVPSCYIRVKKKAEI